MKFAQGRTSPSQLKAQTLNSSTASAVLQQSARQQQQASQLKAMLYGSQQLTQRTLPDGALSQQMALEDEETVQGKFEAAQLMELEEEPLQGKFEPVQRMALEEDEPMQGKFESAAVSQRQAEAGTVNNTGMPDQLKAGIENLSGYAMDDVKVHYNSAKPAQMQAHAYAQGTDIHIAPGQEQHLPHEAWHVVQQKQGRVQATTQLKGEAINDDPGLEHEADVMGMKALRMVEPTHNIYTMFDDSEAQKNSGVIQGFGFMNSQPDSLTQRKINLPVNEPSSCEKTPNNRSKIVQRQLIINGAIHIGTTGLGIPVTVNRAAHIQSLIGSALPFNFNTAHEMCQYLTELDTLLGPVNDPGGIRGLIINNVTSLVNLGNSVTNIVVTAAVPMGDRIALLNDLGNDIELVSQLLTLATSPLGAGSPGLRLRRVLDDNPGAVATVIGLQPLIAAQLRIDEKILRGEITGGAPLVGAVPTSANRNLIGGHSQSITTDPAYVVSVSVINAATPTHYVSFRKLVRADVNGFAADVSGGVPGNIVGTINPLIAIAAGIGGVPPALKVGPPPHILLQWQTARTPYIGNTLAEVGIATAAAVTAGNTANAALAAGGGNAAGMAPFIDAVVALYTSTRNALVAAQRIEINTASNLATPALALLDAEILRWQQNGPVLSANKNSTFAPPGWTDDDVLNAGDLTAATPATRVRYDAGFPAPIPNGVNVDTKHELVVNDPVTGNSLVWVVMKSNAVYTLGTPSTTAGGVIISSFPTNDPAIPVAPVYPVRDIDRFSAI